MLEAPPPPCQFASKSIPGRLAKYTVYCYAIIFRLIVSKLLKRGAQMTAIVLGNV